MIHVGKLIGESLQLSRKLASVNLRHCNVALEPRKDFAVEAATVLLGTFLEPSVQMNWNVLEGQRQHGILHWNHNGTILGTTSFFVNLPRARALEWRLKPRRTTPAVRCDSHPRQPMRSESPMHRR